MKQLYTNIAANFTVFLTTLFLLQGCETLEEGYYEGVNIAESAMGISTYDQWKLHGWREPTENILQTESIESFEFPENHDFSLNTWLCTTFLGSGQIALIEDSMNSYILMDDIKIKAEMSLDGLNRRWDWNDYKSSIILSPKGIAGYYDFKKEQTTSPSSVFKCERYEVNKVEKTKAKHELIENWRKLKKGMTRNEVRAILGEPLSIETYSFWKNWNYEKFSTDSSLEFRNR